MKPPDKSILEEALNKINSIMRKKSANKLTVERKYLFEIFNHDLLEVYEGLPIIKPFVELYFRSHGISVKFSDETIKFEKISSKESISEDLDTNLKNLLKSLPEVKAVTIVSAEGLPIVSALSRGVDETRIAAMNAALLSLAVSSLKEMKKGEFEQLFIKGSDGYLLLLQAGHNTVFNVSTTKDVKLGFLFLESQRICKKIEKILTEDKDLSKNEQFYCKHCGAKLQEGQSICHVCGNKIN